MATKFGRKNPWSKCNSLLGQRSCKGQPGSTRGSNYLEMPCGHQIWKERTPDQSVMHRWVKGHAGVSWGQPEGNCLEMRKAIKCSQRYRALCSCRCSSIYINKFAMFVCLSRYAFGRASTYGAETWHGGRVWRVGGNRHFSSRPDRSKVI